tara:strand:+ start:2460 stop:3365 length:906 start_codon:yes stop_codon:yes gene_type:complete
MQLATFPIQTPFAQQQLKHRLGALLNQDKLFKAIDSDPALIGAAVVFIDSRGTSVTLREFEPLCFIKPVKVILREPPIGVPALEYVSEVKANQRENRVVLEAAGAALSCGAMVLGWVVVFTSGAAIPFSGGSSTVLTVLAYGAATASTIQCVNGTVRTALEANRPEWNDLLDSQEWYQNAALAVDVVSLGGAGAAGAMTLRGVKLLSSQGIATKEVLKGLNRQQRKRLSREIARSNQPGISNGMIKFFERAGKLEKRFSNEAIRSTTLRQLKDSIGAGLTFGGSALGGSIHSVAVAVVAEE